MSWHACCHAVHKQWHLVIGMGASHWLEISGGPYPWVANLVWQKLSGWGREGIPLKEKEGLRKEGGNEEGCWDGGAEGRELTRLILTWSKLVQTVGKLSYSLIGDTVGRKNECVCVVWVCIGVWITAREACSVVFRAEHTVGVWIPLESCLNALVLGFSIKDLGPEGKRLVWKYRSPSSLVPKSLGLE